MKRRYGLPVSIDRPAVHPIPHLVVPVQAKHPAPIEVGLELRRPLPEYDGGHGLRMPLFAWAWKTRAQAVEGSAPAAAIPDQWFEVCTAAG